MIRYFFMALLSIGCRDKTFVPPAENDDSGQLTDINEDTENTDTDTEEENPNENNSNDSENNPSANDNSDENTHNGTVPEDTGNPINPDFLIYTFSHGYNNGQITSVIIDDEEKRGTFSAILYDSNLGDYCAVQWFFDSSSVVDDDAMNSGSIDLHGIESETWFGFIITSTPQTSGNCSGLDANGEYFKDIIMHDEPGFGYGPLTDNLESYLSESHDENWNDIEGYVFSGIISSYIFSEHQERIYLDINTAYAYPIQNNETTWNPDHDALPQGSEISLSELPSDGFYVSRYFFGIGLH